MYNCRNRKLIGMIKIDPIDKQISDLLIIDGRMSCPEIAWRIGNISERSVRYRIERLVKNGVIAIRATVDASKVGFPVVGDVYLEVEPGLVREIAGMLAEFEMISYIACSTGDKEISFQVYARDHKEIYTLVTEEISKIPGVRKAHISFVPFVVKDDLNWPIPISCVTQSNDD